MKVTRHNYQSYLISYLDGELPLPERLAVARFLADNPDLHVEWEQMQQIKLAPDTGIQYPNKHTLYRKSPAPPAISSGPSESEFIRYHDQELTPEERARVDAYLDEYPEWQPTFETLRQARFYPAATITYPNKQALYRPKKTRTLLRSLWLRTAAAAVFLFIASLVTFYWLNEPKIPPTPIASGNSPLTNPLPLDRITANDSPATPQFTVNKENANNNSMRPKLTGKPDASSSFALANEHTELAHTTTAAEGKSDDLMHEPDHNTLLSEALPTTPLPKQDGNIAAAAVPLAPAPEIVWANYNSSNDQALDKMIDRKIKFRTALRKVSRLLEKTRGTSRTDNDRGRNLQVAFLTIELEQR